MGLLNKFYRHNSTLLPMSSPYFVQASPFIHWYGNHKPWEILDTHCFPSPYFSNKLWSTVWKETMDSLKDFVDNEQLQAVIQALVQKQSQTSLIHASNVEPQVENQEHFQYKDENEQSSQLKRDFLYKEEDGRRIKRNVGDIIYKDELQEQMHSRTKRDFESFLYRDERQEQMHTRSKRDFESFLYKEERQELKHTRSKRDVGSFIYRDELHTRSKRDDGSFIYRDELHTRSKRDAQSFIYRDEKHIRSRRDVGNFLYKDELHRQKRDEDGSIDKLKNIPRVVKREDRAQSMRSSHNHIQNVFIQGL